MRRLKSIGSKLMSYLRGCWERLTGVDEKLVKGLTVKFLDEIKKDMQKAEEAKKRWIDRAIWNNGFLPKK